MADIFNNGIDDSITDVRGQRKAAAASSGGGQYILARNAKLSKFVEPTPEKAVVLRNFPTSMEPKGKRTTTNLSYPLDVEYDQHQGHHIIFEIMEQNKAKILANKKEAAARAYRGLADAFEHGGDIGASPAPPPPPAVKTSGGKVANSLQLQQKSTVAMRTCIALYMPPSVKVSYAADYGEGGEIGLLAESGSDMIEAFMGQTGGMNKETMLSSASKLMDSGKTGLTQFALKAMDTVAPGAKALMAISEGKVITPRMELMFNGIGRRQFSFDFNFIPKSEVEAMTVERIIHKFKYHMASNYDTGAAGVRKMDIPDHFNIKYMYKDTENLHLNRISTCVLKDMEISYGGDRYVTYPDGRPQSSQVSLTFQELEIITKNDIALGF
jgi:hypothetical protein